MENKIGIVFHSHLCSFCEILFITHNLVESRYGSTEAMSHANSCVTDTQSDF